MTVKELIAKLSEYNPDLEVASQCICNPHAVADVEITDKIIRYYPNSDEFVGINKIVGKWVVLK